MRTQIANRSTGGSKHSGFTMIELLIAMAIIAVLMAILIPVIGTIRQKAHVARAQTEIKALETAIADFQGSYGSTPPSRIFLYETGDDGGATDPSWGAHADDAATLDIDENEERIRSRAIIRSLWPQFDFALDRDLNGDGDTTDVVRLNGSECLLAFLGGVFEANGARVGFAKNPANPFATGGTRVGPFFEFETARMGDLDSDGFQEYRDPLPSQTQPYLYLSSYDGRGYQLNDMETLDYTATNVTLAMQDIYRQGATTLSAAWKSRAFQIISPGYDKGYGLGGEFDPTTADQMLINDGADNREPERDNISNFHTGTLVP